MQNMRINFVFLGHLCAVAVGENPLGTVLSLMNELTAKATKDGEVEAKAYKEYFEWCDDTTKNVAYAIETAEKEKAKLKASITEFTSNVDSASAKIDDLAASIASGQKDLKDATAVREKEAADFKSAEVELAETIDQLSRAIGIISKEMAKNPAAFAQVDTSKAASVAKALGAVIDAAAFSTQEKNQLVAMVQSQQSEEDDDSEPGAPAAATYKSQNGGILEVLEDLKEKAEGQLSDLRKSEVNNKQNFDMLKQSLLAQVAVESKDMGEQKAGRSGDSESKASAEGDLEVSSKEAAASKNQLATARGSCLQVAADHEATVAARKEELAVIAQAKKILSDTSSGAVSQTYSFLQTSAGSQLQTRADLAGSEVVIAVKHLAKQQHSPALAQLAKRIASVLRFGRSKGGDRFAKIKGLISDMIAKLESEADADATEKAYCDEQMAKTEAKKSELGDDIEKMTSRLDRAKAKSAQLKEEIKALDSELAALAKEQAEMDKIRREENADFTTAKADLELGLNGVRKALVLLRDYYGAASAAMLQDDSKFGAYLQQPAAPEKHGKSSGAGGSIIDVLEVCESDFATNLAKEEGEEADAQNQYEKISQENAVTKTMKEQDVKYKTQEAKSQDKTAAEYASDRDTANTELSAVLEYYDKIKDRCIAKPETYEDRKARREAEIQGLKQAMSILEDETALVQRKRHGHIRGNLAAM